MSKVSRRVQERAIKVHRVTKRNIQGEAVARDIVQKGDTVIRIVRYQYTLRSARLIHI
jgi:hypothetical protein